MLEAPQQKYRPFAPVNLTDRTWPGRTLQVAPLWLSTDLRDGNQALFEPLGVDAKRELFDLLCAVGFQEIEVGFPSASRADFAFVRHLIEHDAVPDDVTIGVLTPARADLIERSIEALAGARRAIVHVYNAVSPAFRRVVFRKTKAKVMAMAVDAARYVRTLTDRRPETQWILQYSPETFSATELEYSKAVCDAVIAAFGATETRPAIINLPATVEAATPNIFADQVEWMHRHIARREAVVLSVHPHNDRGTAVAAAELALMAGAERVEGCLFGNGERTGNVDLVTLALNLYTQGVSPGLDFSRLDEIAHTTSRLTRLPIHPRHPYVGDLVYTAFSGSHQDAIRKGLAAQRPDRPWDVPYLPLDPRDVGRDYQAVIRVNSQSGKGGVAHLLEAHYGIVLPRRMLIGLSAAVQARADETGCEITASDIWAVFCNHYLSGTEMIRYRGHEWAAGTGGDYMRLHLVVDGQAVCCAGRGDGPLDAACHALSGAMRLSRHEEQAVRCQSGGTLVIVEVTGREDGRVVTAAGLHESAMTASLEALVRAWSGLVSGAEAGPRAVMTRFAADG
ncbi:2-isopropylmalate synthase [Acidiferrobacter sp.]|uniref:2-isopropylmalate synthase n=1 Tax=Acidiferrobacter sp. TaxID=1872107 RepID=UPI0026225318|nr:2-isopropylmalate synthase [Acidiferrobacter sp.]